MKGETSILQDPFIQSLSMGLSRPLPGWQAQIRMAHPVRYRRCTPLADARQAGVLALLVPKEGQWHVVFIERQCHNPNDRHGGQISFPGGGWSPQDSDLSQTALRETEEEIGVPASDIRLLGALTELYIPISNFVVYPYVGVVAYQPVFRPQYEEVKEVLTAPFNWFYRPEALKRGKLRAWPGIELENVPWFDLHGKVLWGATAMILSELLEVACQD